MPCTGVISAASPGVRRAEGSSCERPATHALLCWTRERPFQSLAQDGPLYRVSVSAWSRARVTQCNLPGCELLSEHEASGRKYHIRLQVRGRAWSEELGVSPTVLGLI